MTVKARSRHQAKLANGQNIKNQFDYKKKNDDDKEEKK